MMRSMLFSLALLFSVLDAAAQDSTAPAAPRAVLVTGASTGIGRATVELLAKSGFFVYAGARKEVDLQELSAIPNMQGIRLDVTKQEEIDAAVQAGSAKRKLTHLASEN